MKSFAITNIYAAMILLLFAACTDYDKYEDNGPQPQMNVYIAGYLGDYNNSTAVVWKNGRAIMFPDYEDCRDIAISGNDVYVLGHEGILEGIIGKSPPTYYWKMAQPQTPTLLEVGYGETIAVSSNGDVYVGGKRSGTPSSCYWKNGQQDSLFLAGTDFGDVEDIAISGNDVYMAGVSLSVAVYWKNGQKVVLANNASSTGIVVSGNDVYVCGFTITGGRANAVYWKNGQQIALSAQDVPEQSAYASAGSYATGIAVHGNDVYVCGNFVPTSNLWPSAVYWKNGQQIILAAVDDSSGMMGAMTRGIAVSGNDVYVCGTTYSSGTSTAVYWKNGQKVELGTGVANAITIQ